MAEGLSARRIQAEKVPGRYADGHGLYLQVSQGGAKSWLFRYTRAGRAREMGLGAVALVPLTRARRLAIEQRDILRGGADPLEQRRKAEAVRAKEQASLTFEGASLAYIEAYRGSWRNVKHGDQWINTLRAYAFPSLGRLLAKDITTAHVHGVLSPIWNVKQETATRLRGRIERVLEWAAVREGRTGDNPARWGGNLKTLLASAARTVTHHAALPFAQLPPFMTELSRAPGNGALALKFLILTAVRSGEVLGAQWSEIDTDAKLWTIPASRMKANKEHVVPLSAAAMALLNAMPGRSGYVFLGARAGKPLSSMALAMTLRRLGRADITAHGFRSTFRDWCGDATDTPRDVAEAALAHGIRDATEAAYRRGNALAKRRVLMEDWARHAGSDGRAKLRAV